MCVCVIAYRYSPVQIAEKIRIIHPESAAHYPPHASVTAMLLSSEKCLDKVKRWVAGKTAYIVPAMLGEDEIRLSAV
jgi:hypothetical protein